MTALDLVPGNRRECDRARFLYGRSQPQLEYDT